MQISFYQHRPTSCYLLADHMCQRHLKGIVQPGWIYMGVVPLDRP